MFFLIDYDRRKGRIVKIRTFGPEEEETAQNERLFLELNMPAEESEIREIVILEADSEADLRETHQRYFSSIEELARRADTAREAQ